jgi:hypothetical protein
VWPVTKQPVTRAIRGDALAYFAGENYTADLDALGLPYWWLPVGVEVTPERPQKGSNGTNATEACSAALFGAG